MIELVPLILVWTRKKTRKSFCALIETITH
uniref:Uncharacterized protein n=1 Tax=Ascaris lumbricoides TaxID=6252 RepID=A0A0M3HKL7_ASCLU